MSIAAPPSIIEPAAGAVWQVLAPVLGSAGMIGFALMLGELRHLLMAGLVSGGLLVSGVGARIIESRSMRRRRTQVAERYRRHLDEARRVLEASASGDRTSAEHANPSVRSLVDLVADRSRVWERRPHDTDFLTVRLGTGAVLGSAIPRLDTATDPLSVPEPNLEAEARALESAASRLTDMPIVIDLRDVRCLAIVGERDTACRIGAAIIAQLAVFRSPSELGVVAALVPHEAERLWDWMKWLPHARKNRSHRDDGTTMLSTDGSALDEWLDDLASGTRQTIVLVDGYHPSLGVGPLEGFEAILSARHETGALAVVIVDRDDHIPSAASATLTIEGSGSLTYRELRPEGARIPEITADPFDRSTGEEIARALAPLRERSTNDPSGSDDVGLMELLGDDAHDFDPERLWRDERARLSTPIGLDQRGQPLMLDIREAALGGMGPHGILIGATGSGKSELLRTLVLGLAARNSPEDLSLVFADFKGGATFAGLEELPHTAGSISNLESDPTLIDRMHEALFGELERRQRLLRDAGVDRADTYRRRRDIDPDLEAMPSLLVVVDEFGELLAARPDFADLFTSIGRTGRSLGVHLLLSSQRLDEGRIRRIEGHLRYRICLRTFSPEESRAVIGSRASFELPPIPGLGHLAVDSELTRFRAGLANRPIRPATDGSIAIRRFGIGGPSDSIGPEHADAPGEPSSTTEMELIVARLRSSGTPVRPVWLEPLPDRLDFDPARNAARLEVSIGRCDLPRHQKCPPSLLDFTGSAGNVAVVGGPRSGKSTTLATIITSFAATHSPEAVGFHAIDLGGGMLHRLEALPHVGSVFGRSNREEIPRLIRQMHALVQRRADGLDRQRRPIDGGDVFLVIDNWRLFAQEFGPELCDLVVEISTSGLHFGVHVIVSTGRWQDLRLALRDAIGGRFELRLSDPLESEIDRHAARSLPRDVPGRGIDGLGRLTQVMRPPDDLGPIVERWATAAAVEPVRVLPMTVTEDDIVGRDGIGLSELGPEVWGPDLFGPDPHFVILGDTESGKTTSLRGIIRTLRGDDEIDVGIIDYRRRLEGEMIGGQQLGYASSPETAEALAGRIVAAFREGPADGRRDGLRRVLVIDDYELVSGTAANPLSRLADLVARGRDLRFHLVVARRLAGMARGSFDPVMQRLREIGTPTLLLDGDPGEGPVAGSVQATRRPPGRGLLVGRSTPTLVQIARFEPAAPLHVVAEEESA